MPCTGFIRADVRYYVYDDEDVPTTTSSITSVATAARTSATREDVFDLCDGAAGRTVFD